MSEKIESNKKSTNIKSNLREILESKLLLFGMGVQVSVIYSIIIDLKRILGNKNLDTTLLELGARLNLTNQVILIVGIVLVGIYMAFLCRYLKGKIKLIAYKKYIKIVMVVDILWLLAPYVCYLFLM